MFANVCSATLIGIDACQVSVESEIARGLPQFLIVGLPDASVNESRERVKAALKASGFEIPLGRIVVNMAPADLRKEGSHFDLAIAIGVLVSSEQIKPVEPFWLIGELSLNGQLKPCAGILPIAASAKALGVKSIIVPKQNGSEAALVGGITIYAADSLLEAVNILCDPEQRGDFQIPTQELNPEEFYDGRNDLKYVKGQYQAKRALEIAAAGGHNILFIGEPGGGKSMLAQCLPGIMPSLTKDQALEVTKIYSVSGLLLNSNLSMISERPFRAPHHSISGAGLIGGGSNPKPGEISLAHQGVLFLDELAEFDKRILDNLRQPIETGKVTISRARMAAEFPAQFLLIAACNPTSGIRKATPSRPIISAPLWDRFGLIVWLPALKAQELVDFDPESQESSAEVRDRVKIAALRQAERFQDEPCLNNAQMKAQEVKRYCVLSSEAQGLLTSAVDQLKLTGRTYDHVLRTSRTIADLSQAERIEEEHIAEAVQYRLSQESLLATV
ncbi:MAG: YifB family Mg chelatase-like AAA ATPase [Candidatus Caenarcaniphilales bacterium]|nr:YifB family Mg chelatase-like AAA ATPase [Candidatus Caenarcaniphilales bacterium]